MANAYEEAQKSEGTEGTALLASLKLLRMMTKDLSGGNGRAAEALANVSEVRRQLLGRVADLRRKMREAIRGMEPRLRRQLEAGATPAGPGDACVPFEAQSPNSQECAAAVSATPATAPVHVLPDVLDDQILRRYSTDSVRIHSTRGADRT